MLTEGPSFLFMSAILWELIRNLSLKLHQLLSSSPKNKTSISWKLNNYIDMKKLLAIFSILVLSRQSDCWRQYFRVGDTHRFQYIIGDDSRHFFRETQEDFLLNDKSA